MFDHIVLRRSEVGDPISAGAIAEAMLYYQKVHVFIDRGTLIHLIRQLGHDRLISLLRRPDISAVYCEENLATQSGSVGVSQFHNFIAFTISGNKESGVLKSPIDRLQHEVESLGIKRRDARRFTKSFFDVVPTRKLSGNHFVEGGIPAAAKRDLLEVDYARLAVKAVVGAVPGGYVVLDDLKFEVIDSPSGCFVFSGIDFERINSKRQNLSPPVDPLTEASVLTSILDARADLELAAHYGGDFITSDINSSIIQARHRELLRRSEINAGSLHQFHELVLPDSPSLMEVVDSGERTMDEFLNLLDKAKPFKAWLTSVNPDEGIIRSYLHEVSSKDWVERLPSKVLRYMLTTGADAAGPGAGPVAGFVDSFLVEKMFSGWRPNHFVSKRLVPFVKNQ